MGSVSYPNSELVVYALYLAGGESGPVHTEDIAIKCFELFPDSFSWVKYPQYPDKDIVRVALTDARKSSHGSLVQGRSGQKRGLAAKTKRNPIEDGWVLTSEGTLWIRNNIAKLEAISGSGQAKEHRQKILKQLRRIRDHSLFSQYRDSPATFTPMLGAIADLLRCRVDAESDIWEQRFSRVRQQAEAAAQDDVLDFIAKCHDAYIMQI
jgi:hypothetical protein